MARAKQKTRSASGRGAVTRSARAGRSGATARGSAKKSARRASSDRQNRWSTQEDRQLRTMVKQGASIRDVVAEVGRTESAVRQHVYKLGLALRGRKRR
jgi:DNA-binding NarL/FixJ family response regulator